MSDVEKTMMLSVVMPNGVKLVISERISEENQITVTKVLTIITKIGTGKETAVALRALAVEVESV